MDNCVAERVLLSGSLTESFKLSTTGDAGRMNTMSSWLEFALPWCCRKWCERELRRLIVRCRSGAVELSDKVGDAGWLGDPVVANNHTLSWMYNEQQRTQSYNQLQIQGVRSIHPVLRMGTWRLILQHDWSILVSTYRSILNIDPQWNDYNSYGSTYVWE